MRMPFAVIPVIDVKGGRAVRAVGGRRAEYQPLATPLCLELYVADLDAIEAGPPQRDIIRTISDAFPLLDIWVDGGFTGVDALDNWPLRRRARPVLGSESLRGAPMPGGVETILSLDFRGERFLGPPSMLENPALWPADIIVMCLHSVGAADGPDFERLTRVMAVAGETRRVYAAGGIRNIADMETLRRIGAAGALIASALHDGAITAAGLRNFMDA
jgi:phosphoribosylformimino-5-aminoimidazole carboxamide ribotide isomerase